MKYKIKVPKAKEWKNFAPLTKVEKNKVKYSRKEKYKKDY